MKKALSLALNGRGRTSPNPLVGCVIVKNDEVIGEGWHHCYGHPHAEIEAINDAQARNKNIEGSIFYVTLEPCSHYGKTPPCAERLVKEKISEVVIAMRDPNEKVNGRGIEILRNVGIKVTELHGELENESKWLNRGFVFVHKYKRPFVTLKAALSLDGKMCLANNSSKWLTGIEARTKAHGLRAENDAVLVGVNTVLNDDPELTVRHVEGINPKRIILDSSLKTPSDAKIIHAANDGRCIIFTLENENSERAKKLKDNGAEVVTLENLSVKNILDVLISKGVLNLMVEGGAAVLSSFIKSGLADYVNLFYAPKILGEGRGFELGMNFNSVSEAFSINNIKSGLIGKDIFIEGRLSCSPDL
ncbi:MAG: bifunctional diaminohydroxyphosphoribosylaminopyrimidine deaminase/5-amino-6-(5-phosphoribosylamino)uracil reductase RibD [Synergistaceae bacterium]|nr:bifunctional diaminohydroxyphosphoribosylaminopyrimidine deaminase/5-amino-6-(5-phosphoribosylamino)uracil reductase RibD [Synergistaceae bacterium]